MKNYIIFLYLLVVSIGCNSQRDAGQLHVSVLRGPSAIAFAEWMQTPPVIAGRRVVVNIVDSPEIMQALLIRKETDLAVMPMISAANLYNKGIGYSLIGCPVWGNLYLVENVSVQEKSEILHLFGRGTTPDILARHYLEERGVFFDYNYSLSNAGEVMMAIAGGRIKKAVLGEPFLSMALNNNHGLVIVADLNKPSGESVGIPQTAVLLNTTESEYVSVINEMLQSASGLVQNFPDKTIRILEEKQVFPKGTLTHESLLRSRINYIPVEQIKKEIESFVELIYQYEPKALGGKLPDAAFYNGLP